MLKCDEKSIRSNGLVKPACGCTRRNFLAFLVKNRLLLLSRAQPLVLFSLLLLGIIEPAGTRTDSALPSNSQSKVPALSGDS